MRNTGPSKDQRDKVIERSAGLCCRCGIRRGEQVHHRKPRKAGGRGGEEAQLINNLSNLVLLCADCHTWCESFRNLARQTGWLVPEWDRPERTPLTDVHGRRFYLDDAGNDIEAVIA